MQVTARKVVNRALRLIGVLGEGSTATAQQAQDALEALNSMLAGWSANSLNIPTPTKGSKALSAGVSSVTIGPGGDINGLRAIAVQRAYYRVGEVDHPVNPISADAWSAQSLKQTQIGWPCYYRLERTAPLATMHLLPVVVDAGTLFVEYSGLLASFAELDTVVDLPEGYERAFAYNLAVEIAPEYERDVRKAVAATAIGSLSDLRAQNFEMPVRDFEVAIIGQGSRVGYGGYGRWW
jgi:hypothetical protein